MSVVFILPRYCTPKRGEVRRAFVASSKPHFDARSSPRAECRDPPQAGAGAAFWFYDMNYTPVTPSPRLVRDLFRISGGILDETAPEGGQTVPTGLAGSRESERLEGPKRLRSGGMPAPPERLELTPLEDQGSHSVRMDIPGVP